MKFIFVLTLLLATLSCATLEPKMVSSSDMGLQKSLLYEKDIGTVQKAVKKSVSEKGWLMLYEGKRYPTGERSPYSNMSHNPFSKTDILNDGNTEVYDRRAIEKSLKGNIAPEYYIQVKTPTSAFSFGAELFIIFFNYKTNGTELAITAASGQAREKDKLEIYINDLINLVGSVQKSVSFP